MWQLIVSVKEGNLPPLRSLNPEVSEELCAVVDKMMHQDREARYASAHEARAALVRALPEWAVADQALKDFVRLVARRRPRLTSPFLGEGDLAHAPAIAAAKHRAGPDEATRRPGVPEPIAIGFESTELGPAPAPEPESDPTEVAAPGTTLLSLTTRLRELSRALFVIAGLCAVTAVVTWRWKRSHLAAAEVAQSAAVPSTPVIEADLAPQAEAPAPLAPAAAPVPRKHERSAARAADRNASAFGWILVDAQPPREADVMIDDVFIGKAPVRQMFAAGMHRVTIFDTAAQTRSSRDVIIEPGRRAHVEF
jgi:hypothetical protein